MSKVDISIFLPAIRQKRWEKLYNSIQNSCKKHSFELIICSPLPLPKFLQLKTNVKYVKDLGHQTRASNIAGDLAEGDLITWIADDGVMLPDSLDQNIEILRGLGEYYKNVLIVKYFEGDEKSELPDSYFQIKNTDFCSPYINGDWLLFNNPILHRKFYDELGGLDCQFETCPVAHTDFGIRAQALGAKVTISGIADLHCDHMPMLTEDHMPMHIGQLYYDLPKFKEKYNQDWESKVSLQISSNNWKNYPIIWLRRFKNGVPKDYDQIVKENEIPDYGKYF